MVSQKLSGRYLSVTAQTKTTTGHSSPWQFAFAGAETTTMVEPARTAASSKRIFFKRSPSLDL